MGYLNLAQQKAQYRRFLRSKISGIQAIQNSRSTIREILTHLFPFGKVSVVQMALVSEGSGCTCCGCRNLRAGALGLTVPLLHSWHLVEPFSHTYTHTHIYAEAPKNIWFPLKHGSWIQEKGAFLKGILCAVSCARSCASKLCLWGSLILALQTSILVKREKDSRENWWQWSALALISWKILQGQSSCSY